MNATDEGKKNYLQNEIKAFEGRLAHVKVEIESSKKIKESLLAEVEDIKVRSNEDVQRKHMAARSAASLVEEDRKKLESDKDDFVKILNQFKKEKNEFEKEKQECSDIKKGAQIEMGKAGDFIRLVRDAASRL